jgi:hypothetical protein
MPIGCALMSFGNRQAGMEVVVTSDGRVEQRIWVNFNMNVIQTLLVL